MKCWIALLLLVLTPATLAADAAGAQATTRPAAVPPWPATVQRFAQALLDGNAKAAARECDPQARFRSLSASPAEREQSIERLIAYIAGGTLLGSHGYLFPPLAMGADVAADFKNAQGIPDEVRQRMIPVDDDAIKRANATAVQWVAEVLDARQDDPVGVLVFFRPNRDSENLLGAAAAPEVIFILLKGRPQGDHQFQITQAVYGNPLTPKN